jgi:hypothetical protein
MKRNGTGISKRSWSKNLMIKNKAFLSQRAVDEIGERRAVILKMPGPGSGFLSPSDPELRLVLLQRDERNSDHIHAASCDHNLLASITKLLTG